MFRTPVIGQFWAHRPPNSDSSYFVLHPFFGHKREEKPPGSFIRSNTFDQYASLSLSSICFFSVSCSVLISLFSFPLRIKMSRQELRTLQISNIQPQSGSPCRPLTRQVLLQEQKSLDEQKKMSSSDRKSSLRQSRKRQLPDETDDQNVEQVNKQQVKRRPSKLSRRRMTIRQKISSSPSLSSSSSTTNSSSDHTRQLTLDPILLLSKISTEQQEKRQLMDLYEQKYLLLEAKLQEELNEKDELIQLLAYQQRNLDKQQEQLDCLEHQSQLDKAQIQRLSDKNADNRVNFELLEYQYGIDVTDFL